MSGGVKRIAVRAERGKPFRQASILSFAVREARQSQRARPRVTGANEPAVWGEPLPRVYSREPAACGIDRLAKIVARMESDAHR
jgi:hypothetical protein